MTIPAIATDFWEPATDQDKIKALASLNSLPSRHTDAAEISEAGYMVALEGVTRYGLREAVRSILKGGLNHAFFPSPPELRIQCDKAMEWPERQRERQIRAERMEQERREYSVDRKRSPEEIARVKALMEIFHARSATEKT